MSAHEADQATPGNLKRAGRASRGFWLPMASLWWREMIRFYRQRSRVVGYLGSPLVFWLVVGSGFGSSFRVSEGSGYLEYFYPGTLLLIVLFTSIFGMMSLIEDRNQGFLRSVLVSPVPRSSLILGKVLGSASLATLQGLFFLLLAPLVGITLTVVSFAASLAVLFLISFGLTNVGFVVAWRLDSTHGFHALVNLLLVPAWLLSGAVFPANGAKAWISGIMHLNPLTYNLSALRRTLYMNSPTGFNDIPSMTLGLAVTGVVAGGTFLAAYRSVRLSVGKSVA